MLPRFFLTEILNSGQVVDLPMNTRHHAARVLRLKKDDRVVLFNGKGGEYLSQIEHASKSHTTVRIEKYNNIERESPLNIMLVQAICPSEKMDWLIQKSVEMGVSFIQPVTTKRSVVKLSPERASKRLYHWQRIAIASCEQCGRNQIPEVKPLKSLSHWLESKTKRQQKPQHDFMFSLTASTSIKKFSCPLPESLITLLTGPEGGLTPEEEAAALYSGFTAIRMGKRILRTESTALAAIAAMQILWGDY